MYMVRKIAEVIDTQVDSNGNKLIDVYYEIMQEESKKYKEQPTNESLIMNDIYENKKSKGVLTLAEAYRSLNKSTPVRDKINERSSKNESISSIRSRRKKSQ